MRKRRRQGMSAKQAAILLLAMSFPLVLAEVCTWLAAGNEAEWFRLVAVGYIALILFLVADWLNRHTKAIATCLLIPFLLVPLIVGHLIRVIWARLSKSIIEYIRFKL